MTDASATQKHPHHDHSPARGPGADQAAAADPSRSVWVGASAGTGKTKVLIERTLRLMLPRHGAGADSATPPGRILCLTFTKTAAAEMSNRIYERLARWAVIDDAALVAELADLSGAPPEDGMVQEARRLFARVLDTPGGLKIMTIHSFCQSVLKRFPVEAGLPPHFELMDEQSAIEYLTRCLHDMIADARKTPESAVAKSFALLALHLDAASMSDLMSKIMSKRSLLLAVLARHGDTGTDAARTIDAVYRHLGVGRDENEDDIRAAIARLPEEAEDDLRRAVRALLDGGSAEDRGKAEKMEGWLARPDRRAAGLEEYRQAFLTEGKMRSRLATKSAEKIMPDIKTVMQREAERLIGAQDRLTAVRLAALNAALLTVAAEMVGRYARYKAMTDRLDFDDLVIHASGLLGEQGMVGWVLYKLDEGIDHILVDEAQDTSPAQWRVVKSLAEEFFAGHGRADGKTRTLFVVGDEKQSIFSFQGADPAAFAAMRAHFGEKVKHVQEGWEIFLEYSFRSTRTVLEVVDHIFAVPDVRRGVTADIAREVLHRPFRAGQAGLVEIWPLVRAAARDDADAWTMPVAVEAGDDAATRLARKIAGTVRGWLDTGEKLESKGRAIRAGDVMILVQSRGGFVERLMRALKEAKVPVAGIDRMTLTEEISVMDLLAVAGFALQPRDDLTLATVLKSPLVGMGEDELFALCHGRAESLWLSVQDKRPDIAQWLKERIRKSGYATPYEFFAEILSTPCVADSVSGRRALFARLGFDIDDALDEFLNACLQYEQSHTPALQSFADWFLRGEAQIKREQEQHDADLVRIMTVHASKGLQAPIVFLPDTCKILHDHNRGRVRLLWPDEDRLDATAGVPLWSPRREFDAEVYARAQRAAAERQMEEYRRLFYVALTRAEDRLYIAGYHGKNKPKEGCWYKLAEAAFGGAAPVPFEMDGAPLADDAGNILTARRIYHPQDVKPAAPRADAAAVADAVRKPLPDWARRAPADEPLPPVPLAPSRPDEDEPAAKGPLAADDGWKFRRGIVVHNMLEVLPQLLPATWDAAVEAWLARPSLGLDADARAVFAGEVLAVLRHPDFAPIFGPASRAEVPLVGLAGGGAKVLSGQIDRLCVTESEVLVIDYKTNRPPPADVRDVAPVYLKQMAAYRAVLRNIYPDRPVRCALLWTDALRLMPLPEELLDRHAP